MKWFLISVILLVFGCQTTKPIPKTIEDVNVGDVLSSTTEKEIADCKLEVTNISSATLLQGNLVLKIPPVVCGILECPITYPQSVGAGVGGCLPFEIFKDQNAK